jgi:hypothetical protein
MLAGQMMGLAERIEQARDFYRHAPGITTGAGKNSIGPLQFGLAVAPSK